MSRHHSACLIAARGALFAGAVFAAGCAPTLYDPHAASGAYPAALHTVDVADMQVIRRGTALEVVNATAQSYRDFDVWINQRYVAHVEALPAGGTIRLSLWDFRDEYGDRFNAGGFFRSFEPTRVRLVEIQPAPEQKMVGLITIRAEEVRATAAR